MKHILVLVLSLVFSASVFAQENIQEHDLGNFWYFSMDTKEGKIDYCRVRKTFKINPTSGVEGKHLQLNLYWFGKGKNPVFVVAGDAFPNGNGETYDGLVGFIFGKANKGFNFKFQSFGQTIGGPINQQFLKYFKMADTVGIKVGAKDLGAFGIDDNAIAVDAFDSCIANDKAGFDNWTKEYEGFSVGGEDS